MRSLEGTGGHRSVLGLAVLGLGIALSCGRQDFSDCDSAAECVGPSVDGAAGQRGVDSGLGGGDLQGAEEPVIFFRGADVDSEASRERRLLPGLPDEDAALLQGPEDLFRIRDAHEEEVRVGREDLHAGEPRRLAPRRLLHACRRVLLACYFARTLIQISISIRPRTGPPRT